MGFLNIFLEILSGYIDGLHDGLPHEVAANQILLCFIILALIYAVYRIISPFTRSWSFSIPYHEDEAHSCEKSSSMPGEFSTDPITETNTITSEMASPRPSSPTPLPDNSKFDDLSAEIKEQASTIAKLQRELERKNDTIRDAKAYVRQQRDARAQTTVLSDQVKFLEDDRAQLRRQAAYDRRQIARYQQTIPTPTFPDHADASDPGIISQLRNVQAELEQTRKELAASRNDEAQSKRTASQLRHDLSKAQETIDKYEQEAASSNTSPNPDSNISKEFDEYKQKHQDCLPRDLYEAAVDRECKGRDLLTMGEAMQKLAGTDHKQLLQETNELRSNLQRKQEDLDKNAQTYTEELSKLQQQLSDQEADRKAKAEEFSLEIRLLKAKIAADQSSDSTKAQRSLGQNDEAAQLKSTLDQKNEALETLSVETTELRSRLDQKEEDLVTFSLQIAELKSTLGQKEVHVDRLQAKLAVLCNFKEQSTLDIAAYARKIEEQATQHLQLQSAINDLTNDGRETQDRLRKVQSELSASTDYVQGLEHENGQLRQQLESNAAVNPQSKQMYVQEIVRLNVNQQQLIAELTRMKSLDDTPDADLQRKVIVLERHLAEAQRSGSSLQAQFNEKLNKLAVAQQKVDQFERDQKNMEQQFNQKLQQAKAGAITPAKLHEQLNKANIELTRKHDWHTQQLETKVSDLQKATDSHKSQMAGLVDQIAELYEGNEALELAVESRDKDIATRDQEIQALLAQQQQTDRQMQGVQSSFETTRSMLTGKIQALQAQIASARGPTAITQVVPSGQASRKRDLATHYEIEATSSGDPSQNPSTVQPVLFTATNQLSAIPEERSSKRQAPSRGADDLDDLFEGPVPDLELMVAQDLANAKREEGRGGAVGVEEEGSDEEMMRLVHEEMGLAGGDEAMKDE